MCVSERQTFYHGVKTQHIIHGWIQNFSGHVTVINSNSSEAGIGLGGRNRAFRTSKPCLKHRLVNYYIYVFIFHGNENMCYYLIIIHNYIWFTFQITCIYVVTLGKHQLKFVYELLFRLISLIKGRRAQLAKC